MFVEPPRAVRVSEIEREVVRLWRAYGSRASAEADSPTLVRASVANFVALVPSAALGQTAVETVQQVIRECPARVIIARVHPDMPDDEPQAAVTLACRALGAVQMCSEYITLTANGKDEDQLPGAILPLLVADQPTFLWWLGDPPFGSAGFVRLGEAADRVIVDSGAFQRPLPTLGELAVEVTTFGYQTVFSDLNWARLTPWRAMTASLFDSPGWRPYLDQIDTVAVEFGSPSSGAAANPIAAFFVVGWLASRLRWTVGKRAVKLGGGNLGLTFHAGRRPIAAQILNTPAAPPGRIASLRLQATWSSPTADFLVTRSYSSLRAETRVTIGDAEPIVRVAQYEHRAESQLLAEEMRQLGRDRIYEEALDVAETIRG